MRQLKDTRAEETRKNATDLRILSENTPSSLPCTITTDCLGFVGVGRNDVNKQRND